MYIPRNGAVLLFGMLTVLFKSNEGFAKRAKHDARITDRPDDVPVVKCGEDITLTCVAEGKPAPTIEWWYHNKELDEAGRKSIIEQNERGQRIKIKTEVMYIVRSTLIIREAEESDEGMYQCRASNSPVRQDENINIYQHWKIEEVPVNKVMCRDTVLTHTEVYPASNYNESVFTEAAERAMTSFGLTPNRTATSEEEDNSMTKTSQMTSETTFMTVNPIKPPKPTDQSKNTVQKHEKKDMGKKISKNVIEKPSKKNEKLIGMHRTKGKKKKNTHVSGTTLEQSGDGNGNSGYGTYQRSLAMVLLHLPVAAFVFVTSY